MKPIERARQYVLQTVLKPALEHHLLAPEVKSRVKNSRTWLGAFQRVGDLLVYLKRFEGGQDAETYKALKALGLSTFEDIVAPFEKEFSVWAGDRTTPTNFIVGRRYGPRELLIFARVYDTRAGGMFVLGERGAPQAVLVKATLQGGKYPNSWIEPHRELKYYLKSRKGVFGEHFHENAAILGNADIPVLTFVRQSEEEDFVYEGVFRHRQINTEADGAKWFHLVRAEHAEAHTTVDQQRDQEDLARQVEQAKTLSDIELLARAATEPKHPRKFVTQTTSFARSAYVIAAALRRAKGVCEVCTLPAPFLRRGDKTPYLEVHHRVQLAKGGEDTLENALAICPNCHRQAHFG